MRNAAAMALIVLGLLGMAGDLLRLPALKGLAAVTMASPAPKVFSSIQGLETYSTRFWLEWTTRDGTSRELPLAPEAAARLKGPYNRRNVFGAVLAYGPVLVSQETTRPMFQAVARYALCGQAPLLQELGIDTSDIVPGSVRLRLDPLPGTDLGPLPRVLEAPCP
jgi:hypothetical protein